MGSRCHSKASSTSETPKELGLRQRVAEERTLLLKQPAMQAGITQRPPGLVLYASASPCHSSGSSFRSRKRTPWIRTRILGRYAPHTKSEPCGRSGFTSSST